MRNWLLPLALVGGLAAGLVSGAEVLLVCLSQPHPSLPNLRDIP